MSPRISSYGKPPDVLSEQDDSYPMRETKQAKKAKNTDTSGGIGAFFNKPPASTVELEDVMMNEGEAATVNHKESNG